VSSAANYQVGDNIIVRRLTNTAWIDLLGMAQWGWVNTGYQDAHPRVITAINGNDLTIDAPIVQAIQTEYGGGSVYKYTQAPVENVGIEGMRMESTYLSSTDEAHGWVAIRISAGKNCWVRQVTSRYFGLSCVYILSNSIGVTVEDCACLDPISITTGGRKYPFQLDDATFVLVQRCFARGGRHEYATGSLTPGPNTFVDNLAITSYADTGPHHRYAVGTLFDNVKAGQINVQNRTSAGTGHGWAGAQQVLWNCEASIICESPKGAQSLAIGCTGTRGNGTWVNEPDGIWQSQGTNVTPRSLYYTQLRDRLGMTAVSNVTIPAQLTGKIWTALNSWAGEGRMTGVPDINPFIVNAGVDISARLANSPIALNGSLTINNSSSPVTLLWSQTSGPAGAEIVSPSQVSTTVRFLNTGTYVFRLTAQSDAFTHDDELTVTVNNPPIARDQARFHPDDCASLGTISATMTNLTFNTDTLTVTGITPEFSATGVVGLTASNTEVAVFTFDSIIINSPPTVTGSRPLAILSKSDFTLATTINANGTGGGHGANGVGVIGGYDGGDSPRTDQPPVNAHAGQGPGGSAGSTGTSDLTTSGGGAYGGAGGAGDLAGGTIYGTAALDDLRGGSGAGGTHNKGGGAGGGAIEMVAAANLVFTSTSSVSVKGGAGAASGAQLTSGGGSGGAILLWGNQVSLQGTLNASGGNGGNASGAQSNGGGGGGGRIAIYHESGINTDGSSIIVSGGTPEGGDGTGKAGSAGTVFINKFWFGAAGGASSSVVGNSNGFYSPGSVVTVSAVTAEYFQFSGWTGNVPAGQAMANPLTITLDQNRSITATALANLAINGVPEWWLASKGFETDFDQAALADQDGDGMPTWAEYKAGTNPVDAGDAFAVVRTELVNGFLSVRWTAKANKTYQVMKSIDLVTWTNAPSDVGTNQQSLRTAVADGMLDYVDPIVAANNLFYRVKVVE
jgi:hypothetical protein